MGTGKCVLGTVGVGICATPGVMHRANDGKLVGNFGSLREKFGELHAGHIGADGFEGATVFANGFGFWIPSIHV